MWQVLSPFIQTRTRSLSEWYTSRSVSSTRDQTVPGKIGGRMSIRLHCGYICHPENPCLYPFLECFNNVSGTVAIWIYCTSKYGMTRSIRAPAFREKKREGPLDILFVKVHRNLPAITG